MSTTSNENRANTGTVIVTGIPGAGKTTVARALAGRAKLAAHLDIDVIYELVVADIVFRKDSPAEDWWQLELARKHIRPLPEPLRLIVLAPSVEAVYRRDAARHKQVAARWAYLAEPMRRDLSGRGLWLDTTDLDVDATIAAIQQRWDEAVLA